MLFHSITGVILAGGKGRRMGQEKALIELGGKTLLKGVADCLLGLFSEVLIVTDVPERFPHFPYRCLVDDRSGLGPIGGLHTALRATQQETVFLTACDMPFLHSGVIRSMVSALGRYDLLMPRLSNKLHPLHALYTKKCLPAIEAQISGRDLALHRLPKLVNGGIYLERTFRQIDPALLSVVNINTPEDLAEARSTLERGEGPSA
ncbi:MAG: molybdenum cofactor guanylyltransferase [Nitrospiria bacterium]